MKFFKQQNQMDCGVACVQMILNHYGTNIPLYVLRELSSTDREGVSALGLKKCLEQLDFDCSVLQADNRIWKHPDIVYPLIANVITEDSRYHFVIVYGNKENSLLIADPAMGKYQYSIDNFSSIWTGYVILAEPNENYQPHIQKTSGLWSFLPLILKQKSNVLKVILASATVTTLSIIGSYYFQSIIDNSIPSRNFNLINILSTTLICSYFLRSVLNFFKDNVLVTLGQAMNKEIIGEYIFHFLKLPMNFFSTRTSGDVISRLLDGSRIIDALASASLVIILDVTMFIAVGFALFFQNKNLFFISILSLPIYLLTISFFSKKLEKSNEDVMQAGSAINSEVIESLNGIESIKSFQSEEYIYLKTDKRLSVFITESKKLARIDIAQYTIKNLTDLLVSALVIWIGATLVLKNQLTLGELITFNSLLTFFTTPLQSIVNLQFKLQEADVAGKRLNEVLSIPQEESSDNYTTLKAFTHDIQVSNLNYSYNLKNFVLEDVNLQFKKNTKVAVVGLSGSGKSTLAKLLVKFYKTSTDSIKIDGLSITDISHESIRNIITYIPQETFLFNGTIQDNLTLGKTIGKNKLEKACSTAQILDFIQNLPLGFNTLVEEGGTNFSGGQKKRLVLARALLTDAQVFIFDEITSGMDAILEKKIVDNLLSLENRTMIFITHSLPLSKRCDNIIVLDKGKVIESGSFEELSNSATMYSEMWENVY